MEKNNFLAGVVEKYPPKLLENRYEVEVGVVGCLVNDLLLMDDTHLDVSDFLTSDCRFIFDILQTLRCNSCMEFDLLSMKSFLPESKIQELAERGGLNELKKLTYGIEVGNFQAYFDALQKSNLLIKLVKNGFDLSTPIKYNGKNVIPLEAFTKDNIGTDDIVRFYEMVISSASLNASNKIIEETMEFKLGEEFFRRLEAGEDKGVPFENFDIWPDMQIENLTDKYGNPKTTNNCLAYFSKQINGIPNGLSMICGYSNVGKTTLIVQILLSMLHSEGERIMIVTNEQRKKDFELSFLTLMIYAYYYNYGGDPGEKAIGMGITKTKLKNFTLNEEEQRIARKIQAMFDELYGNRIEFISLEDSDVDTAIKKMKIAIASRGVTTCVYDTFKIDFNEGRVDNNSPEYIKLIRDSRKFEAVAKRYSNVKVICSVQLAINTQGQLFLDASVLSMSKQIKEVCDLMILIRGTYQEELDINNKEYYCEPYRSRLDKNGAWYDEPQVDIGRGKIYRTVFIEKSRNSGNVSSDTGIAYLFWFDGSHGYWKDQFKCRPKHKNMNRR